MNYCKLDELSQDTLKKPTIMLVVDKFPPHCNSRATVYVIPNNEGTQTPCTYCLQMLHSKSTWVSETKIRKISYPLLQVWINQCLHYNKFSSCYEGADWVLVRDCFPLASQSCWHVWVWCCEGRRWQSCGHHLEYSHKTVQKQEALIQYLWQNIVKCGLQCNKKFERKILDPYYKYIPGTR